MNVFSIDFTRSWCVSIPMHIDQRRLCPTPCLQIQRQVMRPCWATEHVTLHYKSRGNTAALARVCTRTHTNAIGWQRCECVPSELILPLTLSLSLSPLFLFDCTLSFTSDASPGFFSNYINPYATPQDRIKNDSLGSTFVPIAQSFRERNDKRAKQVYPDNCSSPARCYCW